MRLFPDEYDAPWLANTKVLVAGFTLVSLAHLLFLGQLSHEIDSNLYSWFKRDSFSNLSYLLQFSIGLSSIVFLFIVRIIVGRKYRHWNPLAILFGYIIALAIFTLITNVGPLSNSDPGITIGDLDAYSDLNITQIELSKQNNSSDFTASGSTLLKTITDPATLKAVKEFMKHKEKGWQMFCPGECFAGGINLTFYFGKDYVGGFNLKDNYLSLRKRSMVGTPTSYSKRLTLDETADFMKRLGV